VVSNILKTPVWVQKINGLTVDCIHT